jgi:phosphoribosylaminoimidazole carboxylase
MHARSAVPQQTHSDSGALHLQIIIFLHLQVIIAGAGGAAHLPGMVAALTPLPVIGVPVKPSGAHLDGLDALASIVQMPRGVPVATVAIGNATNAGLLAVRTLAASRPSLLKFMQKFQSIQQEVVEAKAARLEADGWQVYLEKMKSGKSDKKGGEK